MRKRSSLALLLVALVLAAPISAQEADPPAPVEVRHLTGSLHVLTCYGVVEVVASVGEDGILLVDSGFAGTADAVQQALSELGDGPVRVVINTHGDGDHVGGNALLGREATIIAHPATRAQMGTYFSLPVANDAGLPNMTLEEETTLYFNNEAIKLLPVPGGHTSGDMVVHFTGSKVAVLGDIVLTGTFPDAGPVKGGSAEGLTRVLRELARTLPADTTLVPAHGESIDQEGLQAYIAMVEGTLAAVRKEVAADHTLEEILAANPLAPWAAWERPAIGLSFADWTNQIYASIGGELPRSVCEPLTEVLVQHGVEAALKTYHRLKAEEAERWNFGEAQLNVLGYHLMQRGRNDDAIEILKLNVQAFPDGFNTYDSLGEAYMAAGRNELAIANYKRSLALNPDNTNATAMLERLRE